MYTVDFHVVGIGKKIHSQTKKRKNLENLQCLLLNMPRIVVYACRTIVVQRCVAVDDCILVYVKQQTHTERKNHKIGIIKWVTSLVSRRVIFPGDRLSLLKVNLCIGYVAQNQQRKSHHLVKKRGREKDGALIQDGDQIFSVS